MTDPPVSDGPFGDGPVPSNLIRPSVVDPFRQLFDEQYLAMVRTAAALLGSRAVAEEAVQDAFVAVHRRIGGVPEEKRVAYLRAAVLNAARGYARHDLAKKRQHRHISEAVASPEDTAVRADTGRRLMAQVDDLPARQRECLVLRYFDQLTDVEIASTLGISVGSVKTHLHRALDALRTKDVVR